MVFVSFDKLFQLQKPAGLIEPQQTDWHGETEQFNDKNTQKKF